MSTFCLLSHESPFSLDLAFSCLRLLIMGATTLPRNPCLRVQECALISGTLSSMSIGDVCRPSIALRASPGSRGSLPLLRPERLAGSQQSQFMVSGLMFRVAIMLGKRLVKSSSNTFL